MSEEFYDTEQIKTLCSEIPTDSKCTTGQNKYRHRRARIIQMSETTFGVIF